MSAGAAAVGGCVIFCVEDVRRGVQLTWGPCISFNAASIRRHVSA